MMQPITSHVLDGFILSKITWNMIEFKDKQNISI